MANSKRAAISQLNKWKPNTYHHRTNEKPSIEDVAEENESIRPRADQDDLKDDWTEKYVNLYTIIGVPIVVAALVVLAIKYGWIKL